MSARFEIAVVGAGLAGACAAALLARHARIAPDRIVLLATPLPAAPAAGAAAELRTVALSRSSERVLKAAQAWSGLDPARCCAYERMRVWHESAAVDGDAALTFDAADIGEPNLGYIVENNALLRACCASFVNAGGVLIHSPLSSLIIGEQGVQLLCQDQSSLQASLVVGADGAQSLVRASAGLTVRTHDYRQLAIVANVRGSDAPARTAWQRFLSTGPLALLPLFDGSYSIVWSLDRAVADELLNCSADEFERRLDAATAGVIGRTRLVSERLSFELRSIAAQSYVAARCALIGDAAHVIHPLAGQGANLGLLDAAALCDVVATAAVQREDPGALRLLRGYEQQRRTHNLMMNSAMGAFQGAFSASSAPLSWLVNRALASVNRSAALKRAFARYALGTSGELPRLARAAP